MRKDMDFFLKEVTNQIRSKKAKKNVEAELEFHLNKSKEYWVTKGFDEEDAEIKAVEQMGNPIILGNEFNKLHSPNPILYFKPLLLHLLISLMVGIALNLVFSIDRLMTDTFVAKVIYAIATLSACYLYLYIGNRFLKSFSNHLLLKSVAIIFVINISLAVSGQLIMNVGSGVTAEYGQFIMLIFLAFNFGFYTVFDLLPALPGFLTILLLSSASPLLLYVGSRKSSKILGNQK
ncbi:hypothetical protein CIL05_12085 [Virgibacillus profundi]|uniref:Uncharacterized protein n=1 Tax=Virgibacillus profundi TaxID=2024555 RepID=A0A2A2IDC3_9BACI|nr:permease prefix domain 1-containing protein [Virgibacillus profundi]PAV29135.1 hypothetical protein CIL05_12085 [Virgibacillus profundi]PXY53304.1 hypothetical protein CIT14_12210 [Virgibacillus profundi]